MIYQRTNPVGIDVPLGNIASAMQRVLLDDWGVDTSTCRFFTRVDSDGDKLYFSQGKDAIEVGENDKYSFTSYFVVNYPSTKSGNWDQVSVDLFCHADVKTLYSGITTHTADSRLVRSVKSVLDLFECESITVEPQKALYPNVSIKINFLQKYRA